MDIRVFMTPIHYALQNGRFNDVKELIHAGNVNYDSGGLSLIHTAVQSNDYKAVEYFLSIGANPMRQTALSMIPLHFAKSLDVMRLLIDAYPQGVLIADHQDRLPLYWSVIRGDIECSRLLLKCGSPINIQDTYDETPFDATSNVDMRKLLIDYGAETSKCTFPFVWVKLFVEQRHLLRTRALTFLNLKRRRAQLLGNGNGRDVLRLVAQHIWNLRTNV